MALAARFPALLAVALPAALAAGAPAAAQAPTLSPKVSGATILLRVTRANGTVTPHSTTTDAAGTWRVKLTPITISHLGNAKVEAFFDGAGKYGNDDAACTVPVT